MDLMNIVKSSRINGIKNYDNNKTFTNTDEGKEMVRFCTKTVRVRTISSWGRDEDSDVYIGLSNDGWIKYTHDIENGCGPIKINNPLTRKLSDIDITSYLQSDECTDEEYLMFMSEAYKFYRH